MTSQLRIASLIASSTEIVCALGLESSLVARSHECDFPLSVSRLPVCTAPKFLPDGTSYEIDQKVKAILQESLSVYKVDAEILGRLLPTHIITQSQCEVCAVSLRDVEEAACQLISSNPQIVSCEPNNLDDVWVDIIRVADALNVRNLGDELVASLKLRLSNIAERFRALEANEEHLLTRPRVAYVEWIDPLMAGGNWMPELIDIAGGANLFGVNGRHSPPIEWDVFCAADPEVIVVAPCGFDIARTLEDMRFLTERDGWSELSAVKNSRIYVADGNQFFNRPGPRLVESCEILAEVIHPDHFQFGHRGTGWVGFMATQSVNARRA